MHEVFRLLNQVWLELFRNKLMKKTFLFFFLLFFLDRIFLDYLNSFKDFLRWLRSAPLLLILDFRCKVVFNFDLSLNTEEHRELVDSILPTFRRQPVNAVAS